MNKTSQTILKWYKKQNLFFPWRVRRTAYSTWISEIMLQQTQVHTVIPYYEKWMEKFPNIQTLSEASIDEVLKLWEGLGYYSRAKNIHETSKVLIRKHNGCFPNNYSDLIQLKGIGDYTASAILSMYFNKKFPALDANVKRVFIRLIGINNKQRTLKQMKALILPIFPNEHSGNFNQAIMDIGRTICKPKKPHCAKCPVNKFCIAYIKNKISYYSIKPIVQIKPKVNVVVGLIFKKNKFLISKRSPSGLLANLWELPGGKIKTNETNLEALIREIKEEVNIDISSIINIGKINHHYSHFSVSIQLFICKHNKGKALALASQEVKWIMFKEIEKYSFPVATHKLFKLYNEYNVKN